MEKRKAISKKLRFEVFKRDSFTCQYCGKSAPDVTLHVDHIILVIEGGKNILLNLITSCCECNLGKGKRVISDKAAITKAKKQADELSERKMQLEMMAEWQKWLLEQEELAVDIISNHMYSLMNRHYTEYGRKGLRLLLKKYTIAQICEAVELSQKYLIPDGEGGYTHESLEKASSKIPGICRNRLIEKNDPQIGEIFYIAGIIYNRMRVYKRVSIPVIKELRDCGYDLNTIKEMACNHNNYDEFLSEWGM